MAKLKDEMILPTKLRKMCTGAGGCWFGSLPGEELRKAVRYVGKGKKYDLYFCFGLIEGDWIFKSFILNDKKKKQTYVKEGLTDADFRDIWNSLARHWLAMPAKDAVTQYGMVKKDYAKPFDFCGVSDEPKPTYKERFPVPTGFLEQLKYNIKRAVDYAEKARREGILAMEDDTTYEDGRDDLFCYGIQFVVDGLDADYIEKVLSNIINHETDPQMKLLKTIQKEAVLGIQRGDNTRRLIMLLSSYIDDETLKRLQASFADDEGIRECLR